MDIAPFVFDTTGEPYIRFEFAPSYTPAELERALAHVEAHIQSRAKGPLAILTDVSKRQSSSAGNRHVIADFTRRVADVLAVDCRGFAVVVKSELTRGAVTAILWMVSARWPMKVFTSEEQAQAWLQERMGQTS